MSKGTRRERECATLWKRAGFATYRPATVRFGENDMFGLFDLLAVSPSHDSVHAIQVKSNSASGITSWTRHTWLFRALGWRTYYAVPYDNQGWRIIACGSPTVPHETNRCDVVDERDVTGTIGDGVVAWLGGLTDD